MTVKRICCPMVVVEHVVPRILAGTPAARDDEKRRLVVMKTKGADYGSASGIMHVDDAASFPVGRLIRVTFEPTAPGMGFYDRELEP